LNIFEIQTLESMNEQRLERQKRDRHSLFVGKLKTGLTKKLDVEVGNLDHLLHKARQTYKATHAKIAFAAVRPPTIEEVQK
jgi:hypothetical protein